MRRPWAQTPPLQPQRAEVHQQTGEKETKTRGLKYHNSRIRKLKRIFFYPPLFKLIWFFSFFLFLCSWDWLPTVEKKKRRWEQKQQQQQEQKNWRKSENKRTERKKQSTESEHVRNKPNTQRCFVEQWGKDVWICLFPPHLTCVCLLPTILSCVLSYVSVCVRESLHFCMLVARRHRGWLITAAVYYISQHDAWCRKGDRNASHPHSSRLVIINGEPVSRLYILLL